MVGCYDSSRPPRGGRGLKFCCSKSRPMQTASPSSRRAWIEIRTCTAPSPALWGRPPRGGRGLKSTPKEVDISGKASPSSRRAWIEMFAFCGEGRQLVSPSSRRAWIEISLSCCLAGQSVRRPPRGGRGLKSGAGAEVVPGTESPSSRRAWIEIRMASMPAC